MTDALVMDRPIVGTVVRLNGGRLRFDYADDYRDRAGATPISLSMPTQVRSHPDSAITPGCGAPARQRPDSGPVGSRVPRFGVISVLPPLDSDRGGLRRGCPTRSA